MLPSIHIGPLMLQLPGLALLVGLWLALEVASRQAVRQRISGETLINVVFWGLVAGAAAARLGYALRFPDAFLKSPLSLLALNPQTLDAAAGMLGGLLAAWVYGQRKGMALRPTLDALAPGMVVFALFVGVAHVLSGGAYGMPTSLPWGISLWGAKRHPTQIYEVVLTAAALAVLWRQARAARGDGTLFLWAVGLLAAVRLFVEAFRGDSVTVLGGVRVAQVVAWLVLLIVVWLYPFWRRASSSKHPPNPSEPHLTSPNLS